jgi:hypothetical protein
MEDTIIRYAGPSGLTLILETYPADSPVRSSNDLMSEENLVDGSYVATVTEALVGNYRALIKTTGGDLIDSGWVYGLADDAGTYEVQAVNPLLASISTTIDVISTSITTGALVYTPLPNAYDIVIVAGDAYDDVANDIIDVPVTGDYTDVDIEFVVRETDDTVLLSHDSTGVTLTGGDGTVALSMSSVSTRIDPGDYQYGIEAAYSATSKKTLRSGKFSIRKDYAREA